MESKSTKQSETWTVETHNGDTCIMDADGKHIATVYGKTYKEAQKTALKITAAIDLITAPSEVIALAAEAVRSLERFIQREHSKEEN